MYRSILILLISALSFNAFGQEEKADINENLVQFSGVVLTADSLKPLPYCAIVIKNRNVGILSDFQGFFSLVVEKGDTIQFRFLGYNEKEYIVPDTLKENRYSIIQLMVEDYIYLDETVVYPWNTKEQFKEAFMNTYIPITDLERARFNLELVKMKELGKQIDTDGSSFANAYLKNSSTSYGYNGGQMPANNFLNPFAWSNFINNWKKGAYKR